MKLTHPLKKINFSKIMFQKYFQENNHLDINISENIKNELKDSILNEILDETIFERLYLEIEINILDIVNRFKSHQSYIIFEKNIQMQNSLLYHQ